jgi:hypothetical protein
VKEYKVITQRGGAFTAADPKQLEAALNDHAVEGWRVVNTVSVFHYASGSSLTTVLERDAD